MVEKHFNADGTHVLVHNPETDGRWECPLGYLEAALKRGWELAEPVEDPAEESVEEEPAPSKSAARTKKPKTTPGD